jgi:competence ComEA-like helix-hairpin-helix protein
MGVYTRQQLVLLLSLLGAAGAGLGVVQWRATHPELVDRLERLDREIAAAADLVADERSLARDGEPAAPRVGGERGPDGPPPGRARTPKRPPPAVDDPLAPLDLNRATPADLIRLPGIGPVLARRIVEARETVGRFGAVDDLATVRGLGRAKLDRLRPYLGIRE